MEPSPSIHESHNHSFEQLIVQSRSRNLKGSKNLERPFQYDHLLLSSSKPGRLYFSWKLLKVDAGEGRFCHAAMRPLIFVIPYKLLFSAAPSLFTCVARWIFKHFIRLKLNKIFRDSCILRLKLTNSETGDH